MRDRDTLRFCAHTNTVVDSGAAEVDQRIATGSEPKYIGREQASNCAPGRLSQRRFGYLGQVMVTP